MQWLGLTRLSSKHTQSIKIKLYTVYNFLIFNNLHSEIFCQFWHVTGSHWKALACLASSNPSQHFLFTFLFIEVNWMCKSSERILITRHNTSNCRKLLEYIPVLTVSFILYFLWDLRFPLSCPTLWPEHWFLTRIEI